MGDEIACATGTTNFTDNSVFRDFDMAGDFAIAGDFVTESVDIPFGPVTTPGGFPVTVNLYSMTANFPADWPAMATLEGSTVYNATAADAETLVNVPIVATIPAGSHAIYEIVLVDDLTATNYMRFGCNLSGQTGPFWIMADACGAPTPMDIAVAFGLDNAIVMNMIGDEVLGANDNLAALVAVYPNPTTDILNVRIPASMEVVNSNLYDVLGKDTGLQLVNGTINTSNLSRGVYLLSIETTEGTLTKKVVKQ